VEREAVVNAIARSPLFAGVAEEQRRHLAEAAIVRLLDRGEQVFARGDVGGGMFVVASGSVALTVTAASGSEVQLDVLRPYRAFGEMAVIDGGERIATAIIREGTVLLELPRAAVRRVLDADAQLARTMLAALAEMVRRLDNQASDLVLLDLRGRVAKFFLHLADTAAANAPVADSTPVQVDLRLSQTELARMVGGSRPQVNRILGELTERGALVRQGSGVVGVRRDLLRAATAGG
jgi:CRP-like cAMP-binding protein